MKDLSVPRPRGLRATPRTGSNARSMKSLFGYYGDEPVSVKLTDYV